MKNAYKIISVILVLLCAAPPLFAQTAHMLHTATLSEIHAAQMEAALLQARNKIHAALSEINTVQDRRLLGNYSREKIEMEFSGKPGMTIVLDHRFGDIEIIRGSNSVVKLDGEKRVSAEDKDKEKAFLKEMRLVAEESENTLEIRAEYPEERDRKRKYDQDIKHFSIIYTISVPENADLRVENSFGNVAASGLTGTFDIRNGFGNLTIGKLDGNIEARNQFGELKAAGLSGTMNIRNEHGSLTISDVEGPLDAGNQFGEVRIEGVKGKLIVRGAHGTMTVKRIEGDADVSNSFAKIDCSDVTGQLEIDNDNSAVEVYKIGKGVRIDNSFGRVRVVEAGGGVIVRNQHSSVSVEAAGGDVDISNSFGRVEVYNTDANITVINRNGGITVKDILGNPAGARRIELETSFGNIEIGLPGNVSAGIEASTTFGSIRSDFELQSERSTFNSQRVSTALGNSLHTIVLENKNGSIAINKR